MVDHNEKADRYWALMPKYNDLSKSADPPFLGDFYRKIAARYRRMAKEALDRADDEEQCKKGSQPSGES
jgi:hypothetical protein